MPVEIVEVGPCERRIVLDVSKARVEEAVAQSFQEIRRGFSIKGFRAGKVPMKLIERRFGSRVEEEVKANLMQEALVSCIEDHDLDVIGEPKLSEPNFDRGQDPALRFEATVAIRPEFDLPDLSGVRVVRPSVEVTEEQLAEALDASRRGRADLEPKDPESGTVEAGDYLVVGAECLAGAEVKRNLPHLQVWTDQGKIGPIEVEGLGEKLEGTAIGETVTIPVTFPKEMGIEGDDPSLKVTVRRIASAKIPALDDAFAKDAGFEDLDACKAELRRQLHRHREQDVAQIVDEAIIDELLERTDFPVPDEMVGRELDDLALRAIFQAQMRGVPEEEAKAEGGKVRNASRADVERRLKALFLLDRLAREKHLFATEDDVEAAIVAMARRRGNPVDEVRKELEAKNQVDRLRYELRLDRARAYLREAVEVIDAENR